MSEKIKGLLPLSIVTGVLVFVWVMFASNVNFGIANFGWVTPAAFISWGFYFAAGAGKPGFSKSLGGSVIGSIFGFLLIALAPSVASMPSSSGLSLVAAVLAFFLVLGMAVGDLWYVPAGFGGFASIVFYWIVTGFGTVPSIWVWISVVVALIIGCCAGYLHTTLAGMMAPKAAEETAMER